MFRYVAYFAALCAFFLILFLFVLVLTGRLH